MSGREPNRDVVLPGSLVLKNEAVVYAGVGTTLLVSSILLFSSCFSLQKDEQYGASCVTGFTLGIVFFSLALPLSVLGITQIPFSLAAAESEYAIQHFYTRSALRQRDAAAGGCLESYSWTTLCLSSIALVHCALVAMAILWMKCYVYLLLDTHDNDEISPVKTLTGALTMAIALFLLIHCLVAAFTGTNQGPGSRQVDEDMPLLDSGDDAQAKASFQVLSSTASLDSKSADGRELSVGSSLGGAASVLPLGLDYVPSAYREDFACTRTDVVFFCYMCLVLPLLFFLCTVLPPNWSMFSIKSIRHWTSRNWYRREYAKDVNNETGHLWRWKVSSAKSLVFVPDVCLYYAFLTCCFVASYLSRKSIWFRIEMRKSRVLPFDYVISQGEWVCFCVLLPVLALWCVYWFAVIDRPYDGGYDHNALQRFARGFGRMSAAFLALSLFPVSRNSIWTHTFGVTFEAANKFHKFFAHLFLLALLLHIALWIGFLAENNKFWTHFMFASLPYNIDQNDFTLPIVWYTTLLIVLPAFGSVLSFSNASFRRMYFAHFSKIHSVATIVVVLSSIWHASFFWYYLLPPLALIVYDHFARLWHSVTFVTVKSMVLSHRIAIPRHDIAKLREAGKAADTGTESATSDSDGGGHSLAPGSGRSVYIYPGHRERQPNNESGRMTIVKLTLKMSAVFDSKKKSKKKRTSHFGSGSEELDWMSSASKSAAMGGASDTLEYGMYFRVNIPWLSLSEWHPFYVHSIDRDNETFTIMVECPQRVEDPRHSRLLSALRVADLRRDTASWSTRLLEEKLKLSGFGENGSEHLRVTAASGGATIYGSTASGSLSYASIAAERGGGSAKKKKKKEKQKKTIASTIGGGDLSIKDFSEDFDSDFESDNSSEADISEVPDSLCAVRLDGPFGVPIIHDAYRKIVLVVDGGGYLAVMGYFEHMLEMAVRNETQISVDLLWLAFDPHVFVPFQECLSKYSAHYNQDPDRLFDVRLFYYKRTSRDKVTAISRQCQLTLEKGYERRTGRNKVILEEELDYLGKLGSFTMIMAFGSNHLLRKCKQVAFRFSAHYRCDPFVL